MSSSNRIRLRIFVRAARPYAPIRLWYLQYGRREGNVFQNASSLKQLICGIKFRAAARDGKKVICRDATRSFSARKVDSGIPDRLRVKRLLRRNASIGQYSAEGIWEAYPRVTKEQAAINHRQELDQTLCVRRHNSHINEVGDNFRVIR